MYRPQCNYNVPMKLLIPKKTNIGGVLQKEYPSIEDGILFFGNFKTYGGKEVVINGIYSVLDTAKIETWFRPEIKSNCRIVLCNTGAIYEIKGEVENIELRNQFIKFNVERVKGGA